MDCVTDVLLHPGEGFGRKTDLAQDLRNVVGGDFLEVLLDGGDEHAAEVDRRGAAEQAGVTFGRVAGGTKTVQRADS